MIYRYTVTNYFQELPSCPTANENIKMATKISIKVFIIQVKIKSDSFRETIADYSTVI